MPVIYVKSSCCTSTLLLAGDGVSVWRRVQHDNGPLHLLDTGKAKVELLYHAAVERRLLLLGQPRWVTLRPVRSLSLQMRLVPIDACMIHVTENCLFPLTAGRRPGQFTPSQTPYPYDQFWPRCQFGVYIAVRVL